MKPLITLLVFCVFAGSSFIGCANFSADPKSLIGINISDLKKAKATGKEQTFDISYNEAFDKVTAILNTNDLLIYQSNRRKGFIIAMDFPKQTNTTRVGIFFKKDSADKTTITLTSLSSTALEKAESIIFAQFDPGVDVIK